MNRSDIMTVTACVSGGNLRLRDRNVVTEENVTTVNLFNKPCLRHDHSTGKTTVYGTTLPTRKSCRVINAILRTLGKPTVATKKGEWLCVTAEGTVLRFTEAELVS